MKRWPHLFGERNRNRSDAMKKTGLQIIKLAVSATVVVAGVGIGVGLSVLLTGSDLREHEVYQVIRVSRADATIWEPAQPDNPN
jgi:hypothetical protein